MPKKTQEDTTPEEVIEETPEVVESEAKKQFRLFIAKYKKQNPVKYELKKEELERKLNAL